MAAVKTAASRKRVSQPEKIVVKNPVTGQPIGAVPVMTADAVAAAVERARRAQPAWEALDAKTRARLVMRFADLLWAEQKTAIRTVRAETGKTEFGAWVEVAVLEQTCIYYRHHGPRLLRPQTRRSLAPFKHRARVYYKPYGVVGFITPWNYPLLNAFQDLIPALIAGNAVVLKPSEVTPYTALYAAQLMHRAGIPQDIMQVVTGDGHTGAALVEYVDYIAFTGSTATGRKIAARAGERLIPCSLELGGKDPMIILRDVDLDLAASGTLIGTLENAGQVCVGTERIYVEDAIYDQYVEKLKHYAQQLVIGAAAGDHVHVGSLTNERELRRVEEFIADAVAKGAQVIFGGRRRPDLGPLFFEPAILVNVDHTMRVMREETFGPLIPIMRVKDVEEAIRLANDSDYGLSGSIFTRDLKRGEQLATRIHSGDVTINTTKWVFGSPSLPMGGVKHSGLGRRNGPEGLLRFVKPQSVLVNWPILDKPEFTLNHWLLIPMHVLTRRVRWHIPFLRM